jgi:hypothetical protein
MTVKEARRFNLGVITQPYARFTEFKRGIELEPVLGREFPDRLVPSYQGMIDRWDGIE